MMLHTHIEQKLYKVQQTLSNVLENLLISSVIKYCCFSYVSVDDSDILQELNDIIHSISYFTIINHFHVRSHEDDAKLAYSTGSDLFAFHGQSDYDFYYLSMAATSSNIRVFYPYDTPITLATIFQQQFPMLAPYVIKADLMKWGWVFDTVCLKKNIPYTVLIETAKGARDKRFMHTFSYHFEIAISSCLRYHFSGNREDLRYDRRYNKSLFQILILCMNTERINDVVVKSQLLTLLNQYKHFFSAKNDLINLFLSISETVISKEKKLAMAKMGTIFSVLIDFNRSWMWKPVMTSSRERVNNALGVQGDPQYCPRLKIEKVTVFALLINMHIISVVRHFIYVELMA